MPSNIHVRLIRTWKCWLAGTMSRLRAREPSRSPSHDGEGGTIAVFLPPSLLGNDLA
jgi:hypothetical protein